MIKKPVFKNILYQGLVILSLGIILTGFYSFANFESPVKSKFEDISFFVLLIAAIVIAPITEEFVFRGIFLKNKAYIYTSIFFLGIFIWLNKPSLIIVYFIYLIVLLINYKKQNNAYIIIYSCSFLFSILHLDINNVSDLNLQNIAAFLNRFGFSLIAFYLMLNYGLLKSMLFHFANNLIVISIMFIGLTLSSNDQKINSHFKTVNYSIVNTKKFISNKTSTSFNHKVIIANNITIADFLKLISYYFWNESDITNNYYSSSPFLLYNLNFESTEDLKVKDILQSLEKHDLIKAIKQ
ncbi:MULTISPECIES: CPBP family intramembrane glutamic endopeptidase [Olleya]|uniref:CPBP family intramembrane metalloprotease n=1 Tax=Olleya marilimosa TaxID=272164 RepID=A0ABR8LTL1_9FLAO|nr:CPBP family intramembrane glutamic endopeptidase [Olleya marilimosa]MBD3863170.1 CPBP family intramembrane metalloprotease [Olleya marilimosa]MBD3890668.1 CPBP family intramembrane metalloprotease [Olleya marilimosa]